MITTLITSKVAATTRKFSEIQDQLEKFYRKLNVAHPYSETTLKKKKQNKKTSLLISSQGFTYFYWKEIIFWAMQIAAAHDFFY